jgi:threonine-phosphate decarboxylase
MALTHGGDIHAIARRHNWDWRDVVDFSANINPLGPSPLMRQAICGAIDRIAHYPEREPESLRRLLAETWKIEQQQILLGNGATELIFFLARVILATQATLALPVFSEFHRAFPTADAVALDSPETWPESGLFILTRPANPTGQTIVLDLLQKYLASSRADVLIDESFIEYSKAPSAATLIDRFPRLMILRSLTKFYALPGLRLGALMAHPKRIESWHERREPWQVNVLAEAAAHAALRDTVHAERSLEFVAREREWLTEQIRSIPGAEPSPTSANFVFVRLTHPVTPLSDHLLREKILIRDCTYWPGLSGSAIRIAVRTRRENELLLRAWRGFRRTSE